MSCSSIFCSFGDLVIDSAGLQRFYMIDWLIVLGFTPFMYQQYSSHVVTAACNIQVYAWHSFKPLNKEGSPSGHNCRDMGTRFWLSHPVSMVISLPWTTSKGNWGPILIQTLILLQTQEMSVGANNSDNKGSEFDPWPRLQLSYCTFWIYWVGVNTKFTIWQLVML